MVLHSTINPSLTKSEYYSKMRNSIFNKHKKSYEKFQKNPIRSNKSLAHKEDNEQSYTSKILEKRRKALQKNLSAQKLDRSSNLRVKKNISLNKKNFQKGDESSLMMGYSSSQGYPKIHEKKKRMLKETNSSYTNMLPRNGFSYSNHTKSSNNLNFLSKKKFEESSKMYESIKKSYSKGLQKSKGFLLTSENFMKYKKRKNILNRSPAKIKSSSKKYAKDRLIEKNRKVNRSLQHKQKNSYSNKVIIFSEFNNCLKQGLFNFLI
jgi:hypothetical protein